MLNPPICREKLISAALAARHRAYALYSHFGVGAAVQTGDAQIVAGCNVENASYGLTICAERAAVFAAIAGGSRQLVAIAVASAGGVTPCGACRQVLAEFADDLVVLLIDADQSDCVRETTLSSLLPDRFGPGRR